MDRENRYRIQFFASISFVLLGLLVLVWMVQSTQTQAQAVKLPEAIANPAGGGADLTVELSIEPAVPALNQQVTINVIVRNVGGLDAVGNFQVHLYIDPTDRPPTGATAHSYFTGYPSLRAGGSASISRQHTFTTEGCDHIIYAWVDRDNQISESDENNNLIALPVCIGVECSVDGFETDNICSDANWVTESTLQTRSFCHATNRTLPDVDWVKFTAYSGLTYTLATTNTGIHAQPQVKLYGNCGGTELASGGGSLQWPATANTLLYARIEHQDGAAPGPLTDYSLTLSSESEISDNFEPDNRCGLAREITTDGVRQSHLFQTPGDQDWLKFTIKAGESFIIVGDNTATGVNPQITLFPSCDAVPSEKSLGVTATQVEQTATTDRTYYARVKNETDLFGANASYDVSVTASDCLSDALEEDDSRNSATTVTVDGSKQTHNFCPARDEDWIKFDALANKTYVIQTSDLATESDTVLQLFDTDGTTELTQNDDHGYVKASRIIWQAPAAGTYYVRVRHHNQVASGPDTTYALSIEEGVCNPDQQDSKTSGDNGPGDAPTIPTDGSKQNYNFCPDALSTEFADQDWVSFTAVTGGRYDIRTSNLGGNSDTTLELYSADGRTLVQASDDAGIGRSAVISFTAATPGPYYVRAKQFNTRISGTGTEYQLAVFGEIPPTPTFTPTPLPTPTPTPTPLPTVEPATAKTLILFNRERFATVHSQAQADIVLDKLFDLADHERVDGAVLLVENNAAVASAYTTWTTDQTSLLDIDKLNGVTDAVRNLALDFLDNAPQAKYVVIVGDGRIIPYRRIEDRVTTSGSGASNPFATTEDTYATNVTTNTITAAALAANMVLTDDYYVDKTISQWKDRQGNFYDLYLPDYAISRLIETPDEIIATIDNFLANPIVTGNRALVTGYDFVQDSADTIAGTLASDGFTTDRSLIASVWERSDMLAKHLNSPERFDLQSINGHSTHLATLLPVDLGGTPQADILADAVANGSTDMRRAVIFNVGCHSGLNEAGVLDLAQAFVRKGANYIGNMGYGWGGSGAVYSEAVMKELSNQLLQGTTQEIGPALMNAKQRFRSTSLFFNEYSAKVVMQVVFYGLPMYEFQSSGSFENDNPFPSAETTITPPGSFGDGPSTGQIGYGLPNSFGAFGENTTADGSFLDLDNAVAFGANEPVQPTFYANAAAPSAGTLRGVIFTSGVYSDVTNFNPVVAQPYNEWVTDSTEQAFSTDGWYPPAPFAVQSGLTISDTFDTVVMSLGQFNASAKTERVFSQMTLDTLYSTSTDVAAPTTSVIDGILNEGLGLGEIKVEASDDNGISRVVVAYTDGQGQWYSDNLTFIEESQKWTGTITGTQTTQYFVQIVDQAGNVTVENNKGLYFTLIPPLPLIQGTQITSQLYLPIIIR